MSITPDSVQPDPRDITPDGFYAKAEDDVEGHWLNLKADGESEADGVLLRADEDDAEGFVAES